MTYRYTPPAHPTPADIRYYISTALCADMETSEARGDIPIPARVFRLINEAITRACDEANGVSDERAA